MEILFVQSITNHSIASFVLLIAVMFIDDGNEKEELYNIIVEKAEKNLIAVKPNRTNIRKPYTSTWGII